MKKKRESNMKKSGFEPSPARKKRRWDKSAGKWRDIYEPKLWPDQYVHHALVQALQRPMMRGMITVRGPGQNSSMSLDAN